MPLLPRVVAFRCDNVEFYIEITNWQLCQQFILQNIHNLRNLHNVQNPLSSWLPSQDECIYLICAQLVSYSPLLELVDSNVASCAQNMSVTTSCEFKLEQYCVGRLLAPNEKSLWQIRYVLAQDKYLVLPLLADRKWQGSLRIGTQRLSYHSDSYLYAAKKSDFRYVQIKLVYLGIILCLFIPLWLFPRVLGEFGLSISDNLLSELNNCWLTSIASMLAVEQINLSVQLRPQNYLPISFKYGKSRGVVLLSGWQSLPLSPRIGQTSVGSGVKRVPALASLELPFSLVHAHSKLTASELSGLAVGDVILCHECYAPLQVAVNLGAKQALFELVGDQYVRFKHFSLIETHV